MNEAIILIKSKKQTLINESINVIVDGVYFSLFVRGDLSIQKEPEAVVVVNEEEGTKSLPSPAQGCPDRMEDEEASKVSEDLLSFESRLIATGEE